MPKACVYAVGAECVRLQKGESIARWRGLLRCMVEYYSYKLVPSLAHNLRKHNALHRPSSLRPGPYPRPLIVKEQRMAGSPHLAPLQPMRSHALTALRTSYIAPLTHPIVSTLRCL
jgi:hypothetical protein